MNTGTYANTHTARVREGEKEPNAQTKPNVMNIIYLNSGLQSV